MTETWKSRRADEIATAYERPAVMPADPARVAGEKFESRFVEDKRRAGVSWSNIARMLGRCEADVRRDHGGRP